MAKTAQSVESLRRSGEMQLAFFTLLSSFMRSLFDRDEICDVNEYFGGDLHPRCSLNYAFNNPFLPLGGN